MGLDFSADFDDFRGGRGRPCSGPTYRYRQKAHYGPYRTAPTETLAKRASSPVEAQAKPDQKPPKAAEFLKGRLVLKVAATPTLDKALEMNQFLTAKGIGQMKRLFPQAQPPQSGEMVQSPRGGGRVPKPDLTRWHVATVPEDADIPTVIAELEKRPEHRDRRARLSAPTLWSPGRQKRRGPACGSGVYRSGA